MRDYTFQEKFWEGEFGNDYIDRNTGEEMIAANIALFADILKITHNVKSVIEFGANIGLNLIAIKSLLPTAKISAVEINKQAAERCASLDFIEVHNTSIYDFLPKHTYDLAFFKGVLIHQAPEMLPNAYKIIYETSNRYILLCEYYNPTPVEVTYRGVASALFKRDFAGEMLELYPDLKLINYGFVYHRDNNFPGDDLTWFLMEK